ncbi:MAG: glycosyltransferase family 9 protein [Bdellovibrionota bacterium]
MVRAPNWIGDHVMALPFYAGLRDFYPSAHLVLLHTAQIQGLRFGAFDEYWELPSDWRRPKQLRHLSGELKSRAFDVAFSLPASWSSNLLLALAGISHRIGFDEGGSGLLLTHALRWRGSMASRHKSEQYADLLETVGGKGRFDFLAPKSGKRQKRIVLAPGAALGLREWPHVEDLAAALSKKFPEYGILLVGGAGEAKWQSRFKRLKLPNFTDFVGQTNLEALCELLGTAEVVVANDSGVAHLSATVAGTPTVVLFGPGNPDYIRPLGEHVRPLFVSTLACRPCDSNRCAGGYGYQACLRQLSAEEILLAVQKVLIETP